MSSLVDARLDEDDLLRSKPSDAADKSRHLVGQPRAVGRIELEIDEEDPLVSEVAEELALVLPGRLNFQDRSCDIAEERVLLPDILEVKVTLTRRWSPLLRVRFRSCRAC